MISLSVFRFGFAPIRGVKQLGLLNVPRFLALMVWFAMVMVHGRVDAQPYPNRPIKIIVPAAAGDSCDVLSRLIAPKLTERLGQSVVIENKAGAGGQLGLVLIKQAPADGYTLGCGQGGNMVIVPLAFAKVAYNSRTDFTPISMMASNFLGLAVSTKSPFNDVKGLIEFAKANPEKLTFGTNGEGAFLHFATEQFGLMAGFKYVHVPHRGMGEVFTQILGGGIDATLASYISILPMVEGGKMKLLGIARSNRLPDSPTVPTIAESVPGFSSGGWFGIIGPAGMPPDIVDRLNKEINFALRQPDVLARMKTMGLEVHTEAPRFFTELLERDFVNWGKVVKEIGFKPR